MKITKGRLRQIIKEELNAVLKEMYNPDYDKVFMVVAEFGNRQLEFWPNMLNPRIYDNQEDADQIAINQSSKPGASRQWYSLPVTDVLARIGRGHPQYGILALAADMHLEKRAASDNDMDTDNDGKISAGELEKELQDIRDDLVDMSDLPWAIPDKDDRNIRYYMKVLENAGFNASQFVNQDSDIEIGQLDALVDGFVEDERMEYEIGDDESGTISVGNFKGDRVAVATPAAGYQTWMR